MTLDSLHDGDKALILRVRGQGPFRKRITEMGFIKGKEVTVIKNAPLRDPIEYKILDYNVSLRRNEAKLIEVLHIPADEESPVEVTPTELPHRHEFPADHFAHHPPRRGMRQRKMRFFHQRNAEKPKDDKTIHVALVGNPNCGKTTLFNRLSGSKEKVGNYGGVTVDAKESAIQFGGYTIHLVDLPGTYSITEYTPEELFVRNYIFHQKPDVIINVVDTTNLERNLYLTTQLIDMDVKVVLALNMYDELLKQDDIFDHEKLGSMMGIPFVPTIASRGSGLENLLNTIISYHTDSKNSYRHIDINYGREIEKSIHIISQSIRKEEESSLLAMASPRYVAIKLLEKDHATEKMVFQHSSRNMDILLQAKQEIDRLENSLKEDSETLITDAKYGFISGALRETFRPSARPAHSLSEKIDQFLTHRWIGFPVFLAFMWLTFQLTFTLGEYPMLWIEHFIEGLTSVTSHFMTEGMLKDLIIDGAIAGVGGVIVFLPNILILFFMISLMEDTGYMARAAFIMDKLMHAIGLHGKSFIPLIMGFGCNVPAVMATRTIESKNDRLLTMLIIPFMSCSARLPVYVLFISAFFPHYSGTMLFGIYFIGILIAIVSALLMKNTLFRKKEIPFVMELPPYRMPHPYTIIKHMWEKAVEYLKKIGGIILFASVLIWALGYFPRDVDYSEDYDSQIAVLQTFSAPENSDGSLPEDIQNRIESLEHKKGSERLQSSYIGRIGQTIEPIMRPLGFDWKMSVSVLTGLAAKEIVVSTMGVLYQTDDDGSIESLKSKLKSSRFESGPKEGEKVFTSLSAFTFILFVLIYFPCVGVIAAIRRESGTWRWAIFSALYSTFTAWIVSYAVYSIGGLL